MIDLDEALARWAAASAHSGSDAGWDPGRAKDVADQIATEAGYNVLWEPGDEEWILLADERAYQAMISIRHPLALMTPATATATRTVDATLDIVEITGFLDEDLRATPSLLQATALPHGWDDDFDTEAFCANDLFVESI